MQPHRIIGMGTKGRFQARADQEFLVYSTCNSPTTLEIFAEDQIATVSANMPMSELQDALASHKLCLPYFEPLLGFCGTVGGNLSVNLPHALETQFGSWREWVVGMTIRRWNDTVAKSGSRVVKSVAGYDAHKLFIGAYGTLGIIETVNLRVYPTRAVAAPRLFKGSSVSTTDRIWIERTPRTLFMNRMEILRESLVAADLESCTIWAAPKIGENLNLDHQGWAIDSDQFGATFHGTLRSPPTLGRAAKQKLDPISFLETDKRLCQ